MADELKQLPATKKMALTQAEQEMILAYRRKTEVDRAFNAGLEHGIQVIRNEWPATDENATWTGPQIHKNLQVVLASIRAAMRVI